MLDPLFIILEASFAISVNEKHEINILLKKFSLVVFKYSPVNSDLSENATAWTTKSLSGHSLGATSVHEAIYSLIMMKNNFISASANINNLDEGATMS